MKELRYWRENYELIFPKTFTEVFYMDKHKYNPVPKNLFHLFYKLKYDQRYSMTVFLRLTEYFYSKYKKTKKKYYLFLAQYFKRKNEILNNFEHGFEHSIEPGVLFHHGGVTFPSYTRIGKNVQIFKNVTLALVNGKVCEIGDNTIIFSHVIILGKKIGKNCVIGAGSVVTKDIPDNSIVAGVPARVIGICENAHDFLEYR